MWVYFSPWISTLCAPKQVQPWVSIRLNFFLEKVTKKYLWLRKQKTGLPNNLSKLAHQQVKSFLFVFVSQFVGSTLVTLLTQKYLRACLQVSNVRFHALLIYSISRWVRARVGVSWPLGWMRAPRLIWTGSPPHRPAPGRSCWWRSASADGAGRLRPLGSPAGSPDWPSAGWQLIAAPPRTAAPCLQTAAGGAPAPTAVRGREKVQTE